MEELKLEVVMQLPPEYPDEIVTVPVDAPGFIMSESVTVRLGATTIALEPSLNVTDVPPPQFTAALAPLTGISRSEMTNATDAKLQRCFLDISQM